MSYTTDISTEDNLTYIYNPIPNGSISFKVKASNDAHIALASGDDVSEPITEIFIGGWGNTKSAIRRNRKSPDKVSVDTPDILNRCHWKGFWIRWISGEISVGRDGECTPFMSWTDPEPFHIKYFGVCTGWGATGCWSIENVKAGRCGRGELTTGNDLKYNFFPVTVGSVSFQVQAAHDAHIALTSGPRISYPMTEVFIGGWKNTKSAIRSNRQQPNKVMIETQNILSSVEYRGFWIRWNGGDISMGKEGEACPLMAWTDPAPFYIGYFGICTGWGATGSWKINKINSESNQRELSTANDLKYVFHVVSDNLVSFKVRARNDAQIALTTTPSASNPMTEIFLGGWKNTKSVIRRDRHCQDKAMVQTPNILSGDEFRGFWIRWNGGYILVGKEGENDPFMSWSDPEPFDVKYFGVCTGWGATGNWRFIEEESLDIDIR